MARGAERDELRPATRNYVVFGLLLVVTLGLAIRAWLDPNDRRGATDEHLRVLVVGEHSVQLESQGDAIVGFELRNCRPDLAIREGLELLDRDPGEVDNYLAAIAYADQLGFGFVALDLSVPEWGLPEPRPDSARFAVFSVGDVAVEGPRMYAAGLPEAIELDPGLAAIDSLRLGLWDHPDLTRLWTDETTPTERQVRDLLDRRRLDAHRQSVIDDHARWAAIADAWPTISGSLANPWERVQAAPIVGGVLLEVRRGRPRISFGRELRVEYADGSTIEFVATAGLDRIGVREPCEGLPARFLDLVVAPNGAALVVRSQTTLSETTATLFTFAPEQTRCRATRSHEFELGDALIGRPSATGTAWAYDHDWLRWWDATGKHVVRVNGVGGSSGPWWVGERTLAMLGERALIDPSDSWTPTTAVEVETQLGVEPVVVLLASLDHPIRVELDATALGLAELDSPLIDLRPLGPAELLVVTESCAHQGAGACLHRVRSAAPFDQLALLGNGAGPREPALTLETLGPITPHAELAVASDGSRVAWIERETGRLLFADLHGPDRLVARPLALDGGEASNLRISADGRLILVELTLEIVVGEVRVATVKVPRVYTLEPAALDPGRAASNSPTISR